MVKMDIFNSVVEYIPNPSLTKFLSLNKSTSEKLDNKFWFERYKSELKRRDVHDGPITHECIMERLYKNIKCTTVYERVMLRLINESEFGIKENWTREKFDYFYKKWTTEGPTEKQKTLIKRYNCKKVSHYKPVIYYNKDVNYYEECKKKVFRKSYPKTTSNKYSKEELERLEEIKLPCVEQTVKVLKRKLEQQEKKNRDYDFYKSVILPEKVSRKPKDVKIEFGTLSTEEMLDFVLNKVKDYNMPSFTFHSLALQVNKHFKNGYFLLNKQKVKVCLDTLVERNLLVKDIKDRYHKIC